jgi:hypothetical protein
MAGVSLVSSKRRVPGSVASHRNGLCLVRQAHSEGFVEIAGCLALKDEVWDRGWNSTSWRGVGALCLFGGGVSHTNDQGFQCVSVTVRVCVLDKHGRVLLKNIAVAGL